MRFQSKGSWLVFHIVESSVHRVVKRMLRVHTPKFTLTKSWAAHDLQKSIIFVVAAQLFEPLYWVRLFYPDDEWGPSLQQYTWCLVICFHRQEYQNLRGLTVRVCNHWLHSNWQVANIVAFKIDEIDLQGVHFMCILGYKEKVKGWFQFTFPGQFPLCP